jgi:hypothetical protein
VWSTFRWEGEAPWITDAWRRAQVDECRELIARRVNVNAVDGWPSSRYESSALREEARMSAPCVPEHSAPEDGCSLSCRGQTPLIKLQECEHPLYLEQRYGISEERVHELAHLLLHHRDPS